MRMILTRRPSDDGATIGHLVIDGEWECFTLEDVVRAPAVKVYGQTAIPPGVYRVEVTWSPRFQRRLPLLHAVPGFEGVRIHPGNRADDTEGCILPGLAVGLIDGKPAVMQSRIAFESLLGKIERAQAEGDPVTIDVVNGA